VDEEGNEVVVVRFIFTDSKYYGMHKHNAPIHQRPMSLALLSKERQGGSVVLDKSIL
jgi:hypothetical protein